MNSWTTFAQRRSPGRAGSPFFHFGRKGWAEMGEGAGVSEVELTETPDGEYWGWIQGDDDEPLTVCGDYQGLLNWYRAGDMSSETPLEAEKNGVGRIVRLAVRELSRVGR